jgi:hypothetical protein
MCRSEEAVDSLMSARLASDTVVGESAYRVDYSKAQLKLILERTEILRLASKITNGLRFGIVGTSPLPVPLATSMLAL